MTDRNDDRARQRLARERAARRPGRFHELVPPEGVPIRLEVASIGARFAAQVADLLVGVTAAVAILVLLALTGAGTATMAVGALLLFAVRTPYYIAAELLWNGRTLGKRMTGLQVVATDGGGLTVHAVVVRNLMKEVEVFAPGTWLLAGGGDGLAMYLVVLAWIGVLMAVPYLNRRRQRIGDIVAGTLVIRRPEAVLLPDLTAGRAPVRDRFVFDPGQLDHYGRYELQTLERVLQSETSGTAATAAQRRANMDAIARAIRTRIGYRDPVTDGDTVAFLRAFYAAQRAYLEQRRLFGDAREDKFHRTGPG